MQVHNALLTSMTTLYRPPTTSTVDESSTNAAGARPVSARAGTFPAPPVEGQPAVTIAPPADSRFLPDAIGPPAQSRRAARSL